jgi:hypothetical protein
MWSQPEVSRGDRSEATEPSAGSDQTGRSPAVLQELSCEKGCRRMGWTGGKQQADRLELLSAGFGRYLARVAMISIRGVDEVLEKHGPSLLH